MANSFTITISAVDKATATVRKVNDAISRLTRPFGDVGKSFKGLGRELGFDNIGRDLRNIGREAGGAARGIASIVAPMAAITGIGSVAGVAALADNWAKLGRSIDNSAAGIGISSGQLQSFQGAARLAGISSETMTGSLDALATTMQNAKWGRDQGALLLFSKLRVNMDRTVEGSNDVVGAFRSIADAIGKETNPQVQALIANRLGLGAMLPFLRQGSAGIDEYQTTVKRLGYVMSDEAVQRSKAFAMSLAGLEIAIDGTKNAIGDALIPAIKPLADQFTNWIALNRELIAINVGEWAKGFAQWINSTDWSGIGQGIKEFTSGIGKVVDWLGGWENAAIAVGVAMNAGLIVSVASLGIGLAKAGVGVLSFIGLLWKWQAAAKATLAAQGALSVGAAAGGLAAQGGLVAIAGAAGYGIGTLINDQFISGTQTGDWIGDKVARTMAFLGNDEAKAAVDSTDRAKALERFNALERQYKLPHGLLDSVWNVESSRGKNMISPAGARGHFQFMPGTARQYGLRNPNDLGQSSDAAARMFRDLLDANGGNLAMALAAYNWGQGNLSRKGIGAAPAETVDYVRKVQSGMAPQGPVSGGQQTQNSKIHVEVDLKGAPEGTKAQVKSVEGVPVTSRISYSGVGSLA
ncbi:Transglycosylase SLT domain-containing protein [Azotobacter beijerinckii]|uniref:Transglycosylase SLT domain-containing protein n=1 Tax=Azotobacter beijerinckii TaxID=170623 RepID=A0A1H6X2F5_9GAMM|nr:lytic transglycosylase domain-containing protein [Azotobacter beijerinckii]SEJ21704.1 Transglycosylase SLT domain-containing protein [Azotobacter beijerinckii]